MAWWLVPDELVGVFQKGHISCDFNMRQSLEFTQNAAGKKDDQKNNKKKNTSSGQSQEEMPC